MREWRPRHPLRSADLGGARCRSDLGSSRHRLRPLIRRAERYSESHDPPGHAQKITSHPLIYIPFVKSVDLWHDGGSDLLELDESGERTI